MILVNSHVLYLCSQRVSSESCVFSATFAEVANISECCILANSLAEAVSLIYSESKLDSSFIDSVLLDVKFVKRLDVLSNE